MDIVNSACEQCISCNHVKRPEQWLTRECGIDLILCQRCSFWSSRKRFVSGYARLYIMKCKIQDKPIAIEGFLMKMKEYCIQSKYNIRNVEFVNHYIYCQHILSVPYPSLYDYIVQGNV